MEDAVDIERVMDCMKLCMQESHDVFMKSGSTTAEAAMLCHGMPAVEQVTHLRPGFPM